MKTTSSYLLVLAIASLFLSTTAFRKNNLMADQITGAWSLDDQGVEHLLIFVDGYATHTVYSKSQKTFVETRGGAYTISGSTLTVKFDFDTRDKEQVQQSKAYEFVVRESSLVINPNGESISFQRLDDGTAPLTGLWQITSRMQDGQLVPIHRTGTRKTIKILSGTRFQWAAIDPGTKEFMGSGGGRYEFVNGKYTEHIEFFSRDSSRVGASLSFDGKLENGQWHHSGQSSRGDKIYEVWSRK